MTLANRITLSRLVLIPVFVVCLISYTRGQDWLRYLALAVYSTAAISDLADGYVARVYDQRSKLGAVLDPLADKLMINVAFVFLAVNPEFATRVPYWLPVLILGRDVLIVIGAYLINEFFLPVSVRPRVLGKATALFQNVSIIMVLLELPFAYPLLMVTAVLTLLSGVDYLYSGSKQVGDEESG